MRDIQLTFRHSATQVERHSAALEGKKTRYGKLHQLWLMQVERKCRTTADKNALLKQLCSKTATGIAIVYLMPQYSQLLGVGQRIVTDSDRSSQIMQAATFALVL